MPWPNGSLQSRSNDVPLAAWLALRAVQEDDVAAVWQMKRGTLPSHRSEQPKNREASAIGRRSLVN